MYSTLGDFGHAIYCSQQLCLEPIWFQLLYLVAGVYRSLRQQVRTSISEPWFVDLALNPAGLALCILCAMKLCVVHSAIKPGRKRT